MQKDLYAQISFWFRRQLVQQIKGAMMNLGSTKNLEKRNLKRQRIVLLAGLIAFLAPARGVFAQDMSFDVNEAESGEAKTEGKEAPKAEKKAGGKAAGKAEAGGGDVLSELAGAEEKKEASANLEREHHRFVAEEIYAVQRMYVLRAYRLELAPSISVTMNDQYVSHNAPAVALNYWITNVLAVGVNFLWYQGFEGQSDLGFHVGRATRLGVPISQYQLGGHFNFTYVPIYGKFQMFNEYIFQWDMYVLGGVGVMRTRPYPVIDPIRYFDYNFRPAFNVGIGIRVFLTRYLTAFLELRDYVYWERLENRDIALTPPGEKPDKSLWLSDATITNNVAAHIGMSIFLPFDFEYSYPK
jgi:outer membrane beta-barrel protein